MMGKFTEASATEQARARKLRQRADTVGISVPLSQLVQRPDEWERKIEKAEGEQTSATLQETLADAVIEASIAMNRVRRRLNDALRAGKADAAWITPEAGYPFDQTTPGEVSEQLADWARCIRTGERVGGAE